ncbi:isochorismatase family protein [Paraburkholderia panacisoli]|uniref:isochorismatase family protein n=1 Tax=Paraburkholderia panacisoli TaxID=2603818 RepID=UPI001FE49F34|nr:isochorismatase family protein [Paraburkholderia panacisoli]
MLQKLDPQTTALVLIDLQQGILGFGKAPRSAESMLTASAKLAKRFRELSAPVVLVRVGWSHDFGDALKQPVDRPATPPAGGLPPTWWDFPEALEASEHDLKITKRQWNAISRHRTRFAIASPRHQDHCARRNFDEYRCRVDGASRL